MKKPLIIGNWKANPKSEREAKNLIKNIEKNLGRLKTTFSVAVPDIYLKSVIEESKKSLVGVQNIGVEREGAHTGGASPSMYKSLKADFVILGHSEVRARGENNISINEKLQASLSVKLPVVLCIGEKERDKHGNYLKGIDEEIKECLKAVNKTDSHLITLAYEPIWAVGGSNSATTDECFEAIIAIRRTLATIFTIEFAKKVLVLYGGTVNKDNALDFILEGGADGLLIGRTALDAKHFSEIIKVTHEKRS